MASSSCSPVTWVSTCSDAFYFQVVEAGTADADVVDDSFHICKPSLTYWVRSKTNKFLLLNSEQQFQVQNLTSEQLAQPDCKFKIQQYADFESVGEERRAVMLYVKNDDKNMVACCSQEANVYAEEMDALPGRIEEDMHKALFFMTELTCSHTYQFESSLFRSRFLGFEPDEDDPSLNKLVLLCKGKDEVDESCQVVVLCKK